MTKTERIEEMERQLKALKAEVQEEEVVAYPCVKTDIGGVYFFIYERNFYQIDNKDQDFGYVGNDPNGSSKPFTGTITYKNGQPV